MLVSMKCSLSMLAPCTVSRWWFQIFFIFTPTWGRFQFWLIFFEWVETTNWVWMTDPTKHPTGRAFPELPQAYISCLSYFLPMEIQVGHWYGIRMTGPWDPCDWYICLLIYHKHQPNEGEYTSPMNPMGGKHVTMREVLDVCLRSWELWSWVCLKSPRDVKRR